MRGRDITQFFKAEHQPTQSVELAADVVVIFFWGQKKYRRYGTENPTFLDQGIGFGITRGAPN